MIVLAAFFVAFSGTAALAGTAYSATSYPFVFGKQYRNYAVITTVTSNHYASARTNAGPTASFVAPGWVGSRGRLFTSGGALVCEGTNKYNSDTLSANETVVGYSCAKFQVGSWYSYGVVQLWAGSGYSTHLTFRSPNQNS